MSAKLFETFRALLLAGVVVFIFGIPLAINQWGNPTTPFWMSLLVTIIAIGFIGCIFTKKIEGPLAETQAMRYICFIVVLLVTVTVIKLLFFPVNEAHGQTLALGERLPSG